MIHNSKDHIERDAALIVSLEERIKDLEEMYEII